MSVATQWMRPAVDKRILWLVPDFSQYFDAFQATSIPETNPFYSHISSTIQEIQPSTYKYIVAYVGNLDMTINSTVILCETVFGREICILDNIHHLKDPLFSEKYLKNDCIYICQNLEQMVSLKDWFDIVIQDAIIMPPELSDVDFDGKLIYGKSYLESHIFPHILFSKIVERLQVSLEHEEDPSQSSDHADDTDICIVIGQLTDVFENDLYKIVCDLLEKNKIGCLIVCSTSDYNNALDIYDDSRYVMYYGTEDNVITQRQSNIIWRKLASVNKKVTSFMFIGTFEFDDQNTKDFWIKNAKGLLPLSLFEPWAWGSLDIAMKPQHVTINPIEVLKSWAKASPTSVTIETKHHTSDND